MAQAVRCAEAIESLKIVFHEQPVRMQKKVRDWRVASRISSGRARQPHGAGQLTGNSHFGWYSKRGHVTSLLTALANTASKKSVAEEVKVAYPMKVGSR
jgi:hypothetical protein